MTAFGFSIFFLLLLQYCSCNTQLDIGVKFLDYVKKYDKIYLDDKAEYVKRFHIFKENLKEMERFKEIAQKYNDSVQYGINKFSDLTAAEFREQYLSSLAAANSSMMGKPFHLLGAVMGGSVMGGSEIAGLPKKVDWREKKIITRIKNQGSCGGCWAFSSVETVEAMHALKTGHLDDLSSQQVIDCSYNYRHRLFGCMGGDTSVAFDWMNTTKVPLVKESNYRDRDISEACTLMPNSTEGVTVTGYMCQQYIGNEDSMMRMLATVGPVSVAVDASTWQGYLGGIIRFHCGQGSNNHAVLIVGYDTTGDVPFYIVKNSWGADFGDGGYLYVEVGNNVCGIAREVCSARV